MAISDTQKVDYLWKKIGYGVAKTDTGTAKQGFEETIASPLLLRGENIWQQSGNIPATKPSTDSSIVGIYKDGSGSWSATVECTEDATASDNRTWKTNLTDWIGTEFGPSYLIEVYIDTSGSTTPQSTGTKIFAAGSGNDDQWFFDYQAGVLNFIGTNIPTAIQAGVTGKSIYVSGARYIGPKGLIASESSFTNINVSDTTITNILLTNTSASIGSTLNVAGIATANTLISNTTIVIGGTDTSANASLDVQTTDAIILPKGTASQRPTPPESGMFRFSIDSEKVEWYTGSTWTAPVTEFTLITSNVNVADGTTTIFPLPVANASAPGTFVSINGILQEPGVAYSITSGNLVFSEAPLDTDRIDVRILTTTASVSGIADALNNTKIVLDYGSMGDNIINFINNNVETVSIEANGQVQVNANIRSDSYTTGSMVVDGGIGVSGNVYVNDTLYAVSKSFLIDHPTKPNYKLQYACLEGPENGVYVRGKLNGRVIELPEYWVNLVDPNTITVDLTPIGKFQKLYVDRIEDNKIFVDNSNVVGGNCNCFYTVWAERKDIERLEIERQNP